MQGIALGVMIAPMNLTAKMTEIKLSADEKDIIRSVLSHAIDGFSMEDSMEYGPSILELLEKLK